MNKNAKSFFLGGMAVMAVLAGVFLYGILSDKSAENLQGFGASAKLATSSQPTVGTTQEIPIFNLTAGCQTRVIGTNDQPILLSFGEVGDYGVASTTINDENGFWQAASTTQVYKAEDYGCGEWYAYSYASNTISVAEF